MELTSEIVDDYYIIQGSDKRYADDWLRHTHRNFDSLESARKFVSAESEKLQGLKFRILYMQLIERVVEGS